ncbi:hypothetical protein ACB092_11G000400 [Castanea dentata]
MLSKINKWLIQMVLLLFVLNFLYLYFTSHSKLPPLPSSPTVTNHHFNGHSNRYLKPWPILPSYLPWSHHSPPPSRSCEAFFGNGFSNRQDLLSTSEGGWFRCYHSDTLQSSVCEGGRIRMDPGRVKMSMGGERLEDVMGRTEEEELPKFQNGAFELDGGPRFSGSPRRLADDDFLDRYVPRHGVATHPIRALIESARVVGSTHFHCQEWVEEPTLLVTRFEYANLFHTITDWYSAYVSSRVTGLPSRPNVVFVDGHCTAPMEETWKALFSSLRYAKSFSGPVCFLHAIFSPLGYETALFRGLSEQINCDGASAHDLQQNPDERRTARLSEFGELIRAAYGFPLNRHHFEKPVSGYNVLFVRREDYLAHPRHGGKVESRLSNEQEVFDSINNWASDHVCKVNLVNGLFAHMPMKEQVQAIQDASVIIGAHGAGLTHIVHALPKSVVLEIISSHYRRPHFALIARWKGLEYHAINLHGSYANPEIVIDKLSNIMRSLGC